MLPRSLDDVVVKAALHENTADAVKLGAFGVPTYWVGTGDCSLGTGRMFFGQVRQPVALSSMRTDEYVHV